MITQKLLEKIYKLIKKKFNSGAQRRRIKKYTFIEDKYLNTLTIGSGIPSYSSVEFNTSFEESILGLNAKDKSLEITDIEQLKLNKKVIDFVSNNEFTPQGLYTLKSVLSRENIFLKINA